MSGISKSQSLPRPSAFNGGISEVALQLVTCP